MDNAKIAH